ncbi:MAG: ankyrin repeat domain-containing protein [Vicinamibacterales bacterium]
MNVDIGDPLARRAIEAIDEGDLLSLDRLLREHGSLASTRFDGGEGYFARPYLLWFVAENPVRRGSLPENICAIARAIIDAAKRADAPTLPEQLDKALELVASGCVARQCSLQGALIDTLLDAGARPDSAMEAAAAHGECDAVERLLERGAPLTLVGAACLGRLDAIAGMSPHATTLDRQRALVAAAVAGRPRAIAALVVSGADVNAYGPPGFHAHSTALHQAVCAGSLESVDLLVTAGADPLTRDRIHNGTALDWAEHLRRDDIATYLKGLSTPPTAPSGIG